MTGVQTCALPISHGTPRHLRANADIARGCHVPRVAVVANGDCCRLTGDGPQVLGQVPTGRLALDTDGRLAPVPAGVLAEMRAAVS